MRSCKDSTGRSHVPFTQFPPVVASYKKTIISKPRTDIGIECVYILLLLSEVWIHVTTTTIRIQNYSVTTVSLYI